MTLNEEDEKSSTPQEPPEKDKELPGGKPGQAPKKIKSNAGPEKKSAGNRGRRASSPTRVFKKDDTRKIKKTARKGRRSNR